MMEQVHLSEITLVLDSTVITRSGDPEGRAKGYNPLKRGRNSHYPLMAFISQTRMVANAWVIPPIAATAKPSYKKPCIML